ncbi:DUF3021 domain-containing protein [Limosilactobacillus sp. STM2_1]|uniref:DUF3021 domain-containing protein n=2 Tax=Limosilactobacillus rudii TaxID=2759755 RepID=A0A7W3UKL2_9LACO|nr:DUF3021 domain-containing protein [Limosilactobacillus rudii]MBB1097297.1 DUF3021 domain-containing protein [Limosilactobacillus rudii]
MKIMINRFLKGLVIGATTYLVFITFHFQNTLPTVFNTVSVMIISGLIGIATVVFKTDINYFLAILIHFLTTSVLVGIMMFLNHWQIGWQSVLLVVLTYVIVWIIMRLQQLQDVRKINARLNQRK